jgi:hypothetical protein
MKTEMQLFTADCAEFLKKLGERTFWQQPEEKRNAWLEALGWSFVSLQPANDEENNRAATMFEGVANEYHMRTVALMFHSLPQ